jgi:hypothetical protein
MAQNNSFQFQPVALALVRRTFPTLFANQVVGVQAMSAPVGLAYAMRTVLWHPKSDVWNLVDKYSIYQEPPCTKIKLKKKYL